MEVFLNLFGNLFPIQKTFIQRGQAFNQAEGGVKTQSASVKSLGGGLKIAEKLSLNAKNKNVQIL